MSKMKALVGKRVHRKVKFLGEEMEIQKLLLDEVKSVQKLVKETQAQLKAAQENGTELDGNTEFNLIKEVIRLGCQDASELEDADFGQLPLDDLTQLSNEIMVFSGLKEGK